MYQRICTCVVITVLAFLVPGCRRKKAELPVTTDSVMVPYQVFEKATLYSYQGSLKKWRLQSLHMRKPLSDTGTIVAVPVVLSLYDSTGKTTTKILSDSGMTTSKMESFDIWGDVYVRTEDGLIVRSERLELDNETHKWHSDTFVEIRTAKGDVMRGKGFDASESFSRSTFRTSVTGYFPKFKERVEADDEFF